MQDEQTLNLHKKYVVQQHVAMMNDKTEEQKKQFIGEKLYRRVMAETDDKNRAAKVTGMFLEMDNDEIFELIGSSVALRNRIHEAHTVLNAFEAGTWRSDGAVAAASSSSSSTKKTTGTSSGTSSVKTGHQGT